MKSSITKKIIPSYDAVSVPTIENKTSVPVIFACSKTPLGKKVITQINRLLEDPKVHQEFQSYMNNWLSKESINFMNKEYQAFIKKYYVKK